MSNIPPPPPPLSHAACKYVTLNTLKYSANYTMWAVSCADYGDLGLNSSVPYASKVTPKRTKAIPYFRLERLENDTIWQQHICTYSYMAYGSNPHPLTQGPSSFPPPQSTQSSSQCRSVVLHLGFLQHCPTKHSAVGMHLSHTVGCVMGSYLE